MKRHSHEVRSLLAGLSLGAIAMYILDPLRGPARRARVRERAGSTLRSGRREFRRRAEDLRNRAKGALAEVRGRLSEHGVTDEQLVARVRAELGHHVSHGGQLEVSAHDGIVTLGGHVSGREVPDVLAMARRVRGVEQVRDDLQVADWDVGGNVKIGG